VGVVLDGAHITARRLGVANSGCGGMAGIYYLVNI
jgi:hypothetical protein